MIDVLVEQTHAIELPVHLVERAIIEKLNVLESLGEVVYRKGEHLRTRVGPETALAKEVDLRFGRPRIAATGLAIPFTWEATGARTLFPRLEGDLEAIRVSAKKTVLRLRGSYDPPFGWVGDVLDRLLMARIARMTVDDWLQRVALSLTGLVEAESAGVGKAHLDHGPDTGN